MSSLLHLTADNFEKTVSKNTVCLVDFWAPWCGPCRMVSPVIDSLAAEFPNIKVCKINVDEEPFLASKFNVMSIPTVVLFKNGNPAEKIVGAMPKQEYVNIILRNIN